jgi:cobalt-zinc-cadmium resistance protein CzcA
MAQTVAFALLELYSFSYLYSYDECTGLSRKKKEKDNISDRVMAKVETGHQKLLMKALKYLIKALKYRKTIILQFLFFLQELFSLYQEWVESLFHLWKRGFRSGNENSSGKQYQ